MADVRLVTLDPGHFHAALVQRETYAGVNRRVHIYAPLGPDLVAHLSRIAGFNNRKVNPTCWEVEVHAGPDFLERFVRERPGTVAVLAGRNRRKIDYLRTALDAGLHVLADKPWIVTAADLPKLEEALSVARRNGLVAYDIMTERFEITSILQGELVRDPEVFGTILRGSEQEPGVSMESTHYLCKTVAGMPLVRPVSFFDIEQQGDGLADVGTHLVDLVPWLLFPGEILDQDRDVQVQSARHWPTILTREQFRKATGEVEFPPALSAYLRAGVLEYPCNVQINYTLREIHIRLSLIWEVETFAGGGDTRLAVFRGSRSRVEVRQDLGQNYRPELFVVPNAPANLSNVLAAVRKRIEALRPRFPGLEVADRNGLVQVQIPDRLRTSHEAHFGNVMRQFLGYVADPSSLPAWEMPNLLLKYAITTRSPRVAARRP